jgi:uncharacterized protein YdgA (DUF945 family)
MKKLIGFLLTLLILAVAVWGGATWFVAQQTEEKIKAYIKQTGQLSDGSVNQELVSYEPVSFTKAKAVTVFKTGIPMIDEMLADTKIIMNVTHGPVVITKEGGVQFALSRWDSEMDLSELDDEAQAELAALFGENTPMKGHLLLGYDQKANYKIDLSPVNMQDEFSSFTMGGAEIIGRTEINQVVGPVKMNVGEIYFKSPEMESTIPSIIADIDIKGYVGSQMLGTVDIQAQGIKLTPADGTGDITFDLLAQSDSRNEDGVLAGNTQFEFQNIHEPSQTLSNAKLDLLFDGFSAGGVNEMTQLQSELSNLQNQLMWNMEATQNPEGQDKMMELVGQMQDVSQRMLQVLFEKVLIAGKSQVDGQLILTGDKGDTNLDLTVVYTGSKEPITMDQLMMGNTDSLIQAISLAIEGKSDKSMLSDELQMVMSMGELQGILQSTEAAYELKGSLTDGQVVLNGKNMSVEEFVSLFAPSEEEIAAQAEAMAIPEDIEKRIQEEGLTPEVMQILEESEDINPVLLEQLRELSKMQMGE